MILNAVSTAVVVIFIYMTLMYILAQLFRDNSIVDIAWGIGFVVLTIVFALRREQLFMVHWIMAAMVMLWGLRLSIHIYMRNRKKEEDFRYKNWREQWGKNAWWIAFFKVFMLQGFVMLLVSAPIIVLYISGYVAFSYLHLLALILFLFGMYFEAVGDYQLHSFKQNPANKGKIITHGLWQYTRHPNYFGESMIWWGIFLLALPAHRGWIAIISPLVITLSLLYVSGVPMLEKKFEGREDWEAYKQKTPKFVPFVK